MVVLEGLVLFAVGLLFGVAATVFDVLFVGSASFLTHFGAWVFVNALLAVHVENRTKAIWWSVPFNLGFVECYFITTAASYEGFAKSLVIPLAALALVSPLLAYALWTAREQRNNAYGKGLTAFAAVGTIVASYFINGKLSIYGFVISALTAAVILVMPAKRLRITRSKIAASEQPEVAPVEGLEYDTPPAEAKPAPAATSRATAEKSPRRRATSRRRRDTSVPEEEQGGKPAATPTKRRMRLATRRKKQEDEEQRREARDQRRMAAAERRARREEERQERADEAAPASNIAFLGTARTGRRSTRGRRGDV